MARKIHKSQIEIFVEAWLTKFKGTNNKRTYRPFIDKAKKLISAFLSPPCCDEENSVEFARRDNDLTRFISYQFNAEGFDRRKNKKSLERTITLLNNTLEDPCCEDEE